MSTSFWLRVFQVFSSEQPNNKTLEISCQHKTIPLDKMPLNLTQPPFLERKIEGSF